MVRSGSNGRVGRALQTIEGQIRVMKLDFGGPDEYHNVYGRLCELPSQQAASWQNGIRQSQKEDVQCSRSGFERRAVMENNSTTFQIGILNLPWRQAEER